MCFCGSMCACMKIWDHIDMCILHYDTLCKSITKFPLRTSNMYCRWKETIH